MRAILIGCFGLLALGSGCSGTIGSTGETGGSAGNATTSSAGGSGGTGGVSTGGSGGQTSTSTSSSSTGGSGGSVTSSTGGTGGMASTDPCANASDGKHCGAELGGTADHASLYTCASGATTNAAPCANGCMDGACIQPPADPCQNANAGNGDYCGASLGAGDPNTLYTCQNGSTASQKVCASGCQVQPPGTPDTCKPNGDPCDFATAGDGAYCGGSLTQNGVPQGDLNVLYTCQNKNVASTVTCPNGCQVNPPGVADACAPVNGGTCCLNKPPGALTQSYTACGGGGVHYGIDYGTPNNTPIYAGMSGTVVGSALGYPNCYNNGCSSDCWNSFNYVKLKSDCGDPEHPGNDLYIYYLHINDLAAGVGNGTHVEQGQLMALSGNSGCSSGPHIHIETVTVPAGQNATLNSCKSENPANRYCP